MKAISYIKKNLMLVLAGAAIIGFSSFKLAEKFAAPQSGWYEVEQINPNHSTPNDPSNLQIVSHLNAGLPAGGDCKAINDDTDRCAVYLDLSNFTVSSPIGMTVSTATNPSHLGEVDPSSAGTTDGYAKRID